MAAEVTFSNNRGNREPQFTKEDQLLSEDFMLIFQWLMVSVVCQIIDVFGTVTNIINIICFVKQGFKDPINVSLLGLAISDMGCLITLVCTNIFYTPALMVAELSFDPSELQSLCSGWPNIGFTRITCWITAFITFERCLCVTLPVQVRNIITTKRVSVIIVVMFTVLMGSMAPVYMFNTPGMKFFPQRNRTLLGIVYPANREHSEMVFYTVNNVFVPSCAFVIIIICTIIVVVKLREKMKWRKQCTACSQGENVTMKNRRVGKMVVIISSLFIACFVPVVILFIAMSLEPGLSQHGRYRNMLIVFGGLVLICQSINSASNIFIYYHMSSRYRIIFHLVFCWSEHSRNKLL